jgi:hypothetical protein
MVTPSAPAPTCGYASTGASLLPLGPVHLPIYAHASVITSLHLRFDYILDVDAAGDLIRFVTIAPAGQFVVQEITDRLINDGQLHTIVFEFPGAWLAQAATSAGLMFEPDNVGNLGRGFLVDNFRISYFPSWEVVCPSATANVCPCGPPLVASYGCLNAEGRRGALRGMGVARLSADTFRLEVCDVTYSSPVLLVDGNDDFAVPFGNGILCVAGSVKRLAVKIAQAGVVVHPEPGQPPLSVSSAPLGGSTHVYQALYRDVGNPFCSSTSNATNAYRVTWGH